MLRGLLATGALMLSAGVAGAATVEWTTASGGNGHSYTFVTGRFTWEEARAAAEEAGGYLATIASAAEQTFLNNYVNSLGLAEYDRNAWLGGSDAAVEGEWRWVTGPEAGDPITYTNWNGGEPNNQNNEDYLQGWWSFGQNTNGWNDADPGVYQWSYLMEQPPAVPLPASAWMLLAALGGIGAVARRKQRMAA